MNDRPTLGQLLVMMFSIVAIGFAAFVVGYTQGEHRVYLQAVKNGAAHWVAEPDGTAHIEWGKQ